MNGQFHRLAEQQRPSIAFSLDGQAVTALEGDSLLVAILAQAGHLRVSEFGDGARAGFCLMGACQDCWVWTAAGERLRACSTPLIEGMAILTKPAEDAWLIP